MIVIIMVDNDQAYVQLPNLNFVDDYSNPIMNNNNNNHRNQQFQQQNQNQQQNQQHFVQYAGQRLTDDQLSREDFT
eukprot:UN03827